MQDKMKKLFKRLFPCDKNACQGVFGCQCGSFGKKKAAQGIASAGALDPLEEASRRRAFENERILSEILRFQQGVGARPQGFLTAQEQFTRQGPLAQAILSETLRGVAQPGQVFTSTLEPQLQVAEDFIRRRFAQRGLLRSGLPIEAMGRAGVELAIQEAVNRLNFRNQALAQALGLQGQMTNLGQQRLASLAALTAKGQQFAQAARQRAAEFQAYPLQAELGSALGREAALMALPGQALGAAGQIGAAMIPRRLVFS
jgi:hypothetical protein